MKLSTQFLTFLLSATTTVWAANPIAFVYNNGGTSCPGNGVGTVFLGQFSAALGQCVQVPDTTHEGLPLGAWFVIDAPDGGAGCAMTWFFQGDCTGSVAQNAPVDGICTKANVQLPLPASYIITCD